MNKSLSPSQDNLRQLKEVFYKIVYKPLALPAINLIGPGNDGMSRHTVKDIEGIIEKIKKLDLSIFNTPDESHAAALMMHSLLSRHIKNSSIIMPDFIAVVLDKLPSLKETNFDAIVYSLVGDYIKELAQFKQSNRTDSLFYKDELRIEKYPLISYLSPPKILQICRFYAQGDESQPHRYYDQDYLKSFFIHFVDSQYIDRYYEEYSKQIDLIFSLVLNDNLIEYSFSYDDDTQFYNYYNEALVGVPNRLAPIHKKLLEKIVSLNLYIAKNFSFAKSPSGPSYSDFIKSMRELILDANSSSTPRDDEQLNQSVEASRQVHLQALKELRHLPPFSASAAQSNLQINKLLQEHLHIAYANIFEKIKTLPAQELALSVKPNASRIDDLKSINFNANKIKNKFYLTIFSCSMEAHAFKTAASLATEIISSSTGLKSIAGDICFLLQKNTPLEDRSGFEYLIKTILTQDSHHGSLFESLGHSSDFLKLSEYRKEKGFSSVETKEKFKKYNIVAQLVFDAFLEKGILNSSSFAFIKWYFLYTPPNKYEFIDFLLISQNLTSIEILSANEKVCNLIKGRAFYLYDLMKIYNSNAARLNYKAINSSISCELVEKIYIEKNLFPIENKTPGKPAKL